MKIAFYDANSYERDAIKSWAAKSDLSDKDIYISEKSINDSDVFDYEVVSVFIDSRIDSNVLDKFSRLKFVLARSAGVDNIDLEECRRRNVTVCNVPDYGSETVAEFTMFLMLSLSKKIKKIEKYYEKKSTLADMRGNDLNGKTIGIVGAGRIGTNVARLANAFGMGILYFSRSDKPEIDELAGKKTELPELLSKSDVVSLHLPLNTSTHYILNKSNIGLLKKSAFVINTARGQLLETEALVEAIEGGAIGGAALDVIEGEEFTNKELEIIRKTADYEQLKEVIEGSLLSKYDNVILTPHIAYNSQEALGKLIGDTLTNLDNLLSNKPLDNTVPGRSD